MKTDAQIKRDVEDELIWEPGIDEARIGVSVEEGVVTLSGEVDSYALKMAVEKAAKRVKGVKAVAEDIVVNYGMEAEKSDTEIAKAVVHALKWHASVPEGSIIPKVENGWVYLSGKVRWGYQKESAKNAIKELTGVKGVINSITISQDGVQTQDIKKSIKAAFSRSAELEARGIQVSAQGHVVTLEGTVHSLKEKEEAERTAFNAPGVYEVKNYLTVKYSGALV
jgi:osmotically-inducible protein OsmY